jgi:hypothetical protein
MSGVDESDGRIMLKCAPSNDPRGRPSDRLMSQSPGVRAIRLASLARSLL